MLWQYEPHRAPPLDCLIASALASAIHLFTGNNIGPKGDLAGRALQARLEVDRSDPENRTFTHPDPIVWTLDNRGRLLASLYTILLGNLVIQPGSNIVPQTRFPEWWRLVGSAVEHAAHQHTDHVAALTMNALRDCVPSVISFRDLFVAHKQEDEESADLGEVPLCQNSCRTGTAAALEPEGEAPDRSRDRPRGHVGWIRLIQVIAKQPPRHGIAREADLLPDWARCRQTPRRCHERINAALLSGCKRIRCRSGAHHRE
jgi:hypothetical protein